MLAGCGVRLPGTRPAAVHRIAYLSTSGLSEGIAAAWSAFRDALRDLGYVEGENLLVEERHGLGDEFLSEPSAELIRLQTEVIGVPSVTVARAVQDVSSTIPIVSGGAGDLVAGGAAVSLARPGGNVTGLSSPPLDGRQLQLLQETVPTLSRVAVLFDTTQPVFARARTPPPPTISISKPCSSARAAPTIWMLPLRVLSATTVTAAGDEQPAGVGQSVADRRVSDPAPIAHDLPAERGG